MWARDVTCGVGGRNGYRILVGEGSAIFNWILKKLNWRA